MEELHLPDNIKVHFAGGEVQNQYLIAKECGVKYSLYTCFPFVERMVFKQGIKAPIMPFKEQKGNPAVLIPRYIAKHSKHVIQDSGLFTLMFGSRKGDKDEKLINRWYDGLIEFTLNHGERVTCVEVDCQKLLGVEKAWDFRYRMRQDLPNNRIINVFHLEDGKDGLDRLIEFSDYIAISVPELRFAGKSNMVPKLARYIKDKKKDIDIHLLGCTNLNLLRQCKFCTSSDSTTWIAPKRYGFLDGKHIKNINAEKVTKLIGKEKMNTIMEYNNETNSCSIVLNIFRLKHDYTRYGGNQD